LQAAAEQHQPDALSWHNLAVCYEKTGNTEVGEIKKAEAAYKKAIEIDPNYAAAWFNLGGYYWNPHGEGASFAVPWKIRAPGFAGQSAAPESGAKDTRSPDASRLPDTLKLRKASGMRRVHRRS